MAIKMFRERNPFPMGLMVIVAVLLSVLTVLNINTIIGVFGRHYSAELTEAAGLKQGSPVRVSGLDVGRVSAVELGDQGGGVIVEFTITEPDITLGDRTAAAVGVETVLGDKALVLTSAGSGELADGDKIPIERTTAPYDVSQALSELTNETSEIDVDQVAAALDTVSATLDGAAPELRSAVEGVGRLSTTISSRDGALRSLLAHADQFTEILADRSDDFTAIVRDGNTLFAELVKRREEIRSLLVNVSTMSEQLSGLVDDNQAIAGPTLHQLNGVIKTLQRNKTNLSKTLSGLSVYATGLGEVVSSGPFFTAYLQNLAPGNLLAPTLDLDGLGLPGLPGLPTLKDLQNAGVRR